MPRAALPRRVQSGARKQLAAVGFALLLVPCGVLHSGDNERSQAPGSAAEART